MAECEQVVISFVKRRRLNLKPQRLNAGSMPQRQRDALEVLHLFETTGLIGLKTAAAVAAMASAGQPLTSLFWATRNLVTEHLESFLDGATSVAANDAKEIAERLELSTRLLMLELVPVARSHARAPISNHRVGAVVQGTSGNLYLGFNVEIPESPLVETVGAEQAAVINALNGGERGIVALAVIHPPSGYCRQFLYELETGGDLRVFLPDRSLKLKTLLPSSFGPKDMGQAGALLNSPRNNLHLVRPSKDSVVLHALEAACRSYAPYTHCPSGVALATIDQSFAGSYCENAAFNPSLSPLQAALVSLYSHGRELGEIRRCTLVERAKVYGTQVSQAASTECLLKILSPKAQFELHPVRVS